VTRAEAVAKVADAMGPEWLAIACNGMIGRELYTHADAPSRFYMIGSMGLASSIGLGLAIVQPSRTVVVFDGDGNVLMNLGALGSVAAAAPGNLYHVVFDNASHGSTGDQCTISDRVPIEKVAVAAGYRRSIRVRSTSELDHTLSRFFTEPGPAMLLIEVERGNKPGIGRVEPSPAELTARFRRDAIGVTRGSFDPARHHSRRGAGSATGSAD
jgi:thiamine pyrophosphate-dependent acetolactate synthase large subunit-like protein